MLPFWKTLAFWKALSFALAGILGLLIVFGVVPQDYGFTGEALLGFFLSILAFFDIVPELYARALLPPKRVK